MNTQLRLYFIRHGETEWSLSGQYSGRADISLISARSMEMLRFSPIATLQERNMTMNESKFVTKDLICGMIVWAVFQFEKKSYNNPSISNPRNSYLQLWNAQIKDRR